MGAMLQLDAAQAAALQALKRQRDIAALSAALAAAFPEVQARLGERYPALIDHGVARAAAHGLDHAVCVARYLACWFMLGAEFEARPGFAWARDLLALPARPQGAKVFQLCRRTREALAAQPQPTTTPAAFDQAVALLDANLMPRGTLGSLQPGARLQLGEECDIDALDLRLVEPAAGPLQAYRWQDGQWRRLPMQAARAAVTLAAGPQAVALPARLHLLSQPAGRDYARLRLRTRAAHCCDPQVHPLVSLNGPQGLNHWRGALAADITLPLYADLPEPADDGPRPAIAVQGTPQASLLSLGSCGMRESGAPLGDQQTQLAVYPGEQHLLAWQRVPGPALSWPETPSGPATPGPEARCRVERDGLPLDPSRWQAGLQDLDRQLTEGLGRLATAWERESGVRNGRMAAEPRVMSGSAGITWGWVEAAQGMAAAPHYRLAGMLDLIACQLDLRLSGVLALHGSLSRLALHCGGQQSLHAAFESLPSDADALAAIASAQTAFRHPFVLQVEPLVQADQQAMLDAAGPVGGALVGACGLRPRAAGPGLQWFCTLAIEPVGAAFLLHDPLLGQRSLHRPLLPALQLLDWSLG